MAKRDLSGAGASRLARPQTEQERETAPALVREPKGRGAPLPKSFRLQPAHVRRLRDLTERLSEETGRPISEAEVLKGLLLLGEQTESRKLLAAIRDAVFEGG